MKDTLFIISFGLLIYLGFATVLGDTALMGSYGATFASYNHKYFGYMSYGYIFAFMIPLYYLYKETTLNLRKFELTVVSILMLFSFLLAQALLVKDSLRGEIGAGFADFLSPYIGSFGLWTFWFIITLLSVVIIFDKSAHEMVDIFLNGAKKKFFSAKSIASKEIKKESKSKYTAEKKVEQKILQKTEAAKDILEESFEEEIDKPAYLRKEVVSKKEQPETVMEPSEVKQQNIVELVNEIKEQKNAIIVDELEENAKLLESIEKGVVEKPKNFKLPSVDFLQKPNNKAHSVDESELDGKIKFLIEKLAHFKIDGDVVRTYAGPVVSTFEFKPAANVKVSRILNLQDDLAMALSAETIRIQAPIPGKDVVGIEIPNEKIDTIYLRDLLDSKLFKESSSPLTIVLGKDIVGKPFITDLKKLPSSSYCRNYRKRQECRYKRDDSFTSL